MIRDLELAAMVVVVKRASPKDRKGSVKEKGTASGCSIAQYI